MPFDSWMTPPEQIEKIRSAMGRIDTDPASNEAAQAYIRAGQYYTIETNGLAHPWFGNVYCNPPYSRGNIDAFVDKGIAEWNASHAFTLTDTAVNQMIWLVNSQTDTGWYHKLLNSCSVYLLYRKRLKFWKIIDGTAHPKWASTTSVKNPGKMTNSPRYLNTLFYFGDNVERFVEVFKNDGTICAVYKG